MDRSADAADTSRKTDAEADSLRDSDDRAARLQLPNYAEAEGAPRVPKRKLSVFYRSFDVLAARNQGEPSEFRRTSSSPSVQSEKTREAETGGGEISQQTIPFKKGLVNNYRLLIESGKFLSSSSPDSLTEFSSDDTQFSSTRTSPAVNSTVPRVPRALGNRSVGNYATITENLIGKHFKVDSDGNGEIKDADERVAAEPLRPRNFGFLNSDKTRASEESENGQTTSPAGREARATSSDAVLGKDLVRLKDSTNPRLLANASVGAVQGKYTPVAAEMSSHEDSSIGSDSEDDRLDRGAREPEKPGGSVPSRPSSSFSVDEPSVMSCSTETRDGEKPGDVVEISPKEEKRQRFFAARRSLSEGDGERYQLIRRRCGCSKWKVPSTEQEPLGAFPSFTDLRLQSIGLSNSQDEGSLYKYIIEMEEVEEYSTERISRGEHMKHVPHIGYIRKRENVPDTELERKYVAFSIGLGTDRITLQRRMSLSRRNRDQAERNLASEIQQMHQDIEELSPLCTDSESIERVGRVRHRLDMVMRCAHKVSCAAETLGAVCQEQKISRAVFFADKFLQTLRSRCENLASEIAEAKRVLLDNNIVMEESSGEIGDDVPKIRYKNGLPSNNRTMIARRRASIATIPRPLTSQDIKEGSRAFSPVYGKIIRRPSLCSEVPRWDYEKPNRTDSFNSVVELREIFEQTEPRRNSTEENNNLLRNSQSINNDNVNHDVANDTKEEDRLNDRQNFFLEANVTKNVEKQLKLCTRTAESLRMFRNFKDWQQILRYALLFLLGFYVKQIISSSNTCDGSSNLSLE